MIKKIILGISILFSTTIFAQEGTASPYSFYGIGDVKFKGTVENRSMGGLGVMADSVRVNLQNPASYSFLRFTSLSVGGSNNRVDFETNEQTEKAQRTSLDYLVIGLPMGKLGVSFGLMPFSNVGYKIAKDSNESDPRSQIYRGEGGLNRVFLGAAYNVTKKFSIGADFQYNFGRVKKEAIVFYPDVLLGSRAKNETRYSGFSTTLGAIYQTKIADKWDWQSSLTFSPESKLMSDNSRNIAVVFYNQQGTEIAQDQQDVPVEDFKVRMPAKFSIGSSFGSKRKWMFGAELTLQGKNEVTWGEETGVTTASATKLSVGGYFIPKYNSYSGYFKRVTYRAGYKYENTGLVVNNKSIVDHTGTLGFGFPVGTTISSLNLGLEYGKRGTKAKGLIEENYFGISLGLTFSDRWFVKTKYD
ncbi:hypothetical protein [Flavobacterium suncheonense]|uniref:hypothetical protein n=1 Tax=Flavobacterium suncheonense TaxID=350894 RepID=UPI003FA35530